VHTGIIEKQLKYLQYVTYNVAQNYPKSNNLLFSRTSSSVEALYLGYICEAGSEMTGKWTVRWCVKYTGGKKNTKLSLKN
jgi:hypothetical protein